MGPSRLPGSTRGVGGLVHSSLIVSILLFLSLFAGAASAQELGLRDQLGERIHIAPEGTVLLFWSMEAASAPASLHALEALAQGGLDVVAVNTDPADAAARIRPFLARHGLQLRSAHDPTRELADRYRAAAGQALVLDKQIRVAWRGADIAEIPPPAEPPPAATTALGGE